MSRVGDVEMDGSQDDMLGGAPDEVIERLYRVYFHPLRHYFIRRLQGHSDAYALGEEMAVETFSKAYIALRNGTGPRQYAKGWLYRVAHNLFVDYLRYQKRYARTLSLDSPDRDDPDEVEGYYAPQWTIDPAQDVERIVGARVEVEALVPRWRKLTCDQQAVLWLRLVDGYAFEEIAEMMDKTEGAVKALLHRGLNRLNPQRPAAAKSKAHNARSDERRKPIHPVHLEQEVLVC